MLCVYLEFTDLIKQVAQAVGGSVEILVGTSGLFVLWSIGQVKDQFRLELPSTSSTSL